MSFYDVYHHQYGGGGRGVDNVYVGAYRQKGHGLGSFFTGLFRSALPFLAKGARAVGKEALRAGVGILNDVADNNMTFKESFNTRVQESGQKLKRKAVDKINKIMEGSGYNTLPRKRRAQSRRRRVTSKSSLAVKKNSRVSKRGKVKKLKRRVKRKIKRAGKKQKSFKKKSKGSAKKKRSKVRDIFDY